VIRELLDLLVRHPGDLVFERLTSGITTRGGRGTRQILPLRTKGIIFCSIFKMKKCNGNKAKMCKINLLKLPFLSVFLLGTFLSYAQVTTPGIRTKPSASTITYGQTLSVSTLSGGLAGQIGEVSTLANLSGWGLPSGIAMDSSGILYVSYYGSGGGILKITLSGDVSGFVGSTFGFANGTGTSAMFRQPSGLAVDSVGNVFVADRYNHRLRKVTPQGVVTTVIGSGSAGYPLDEPTGVAVDSSGNVYISDKSNRIRRVNPANTNPISTLTANGFSTNLTSVIEFIGTPYGITLDSARNIFIAESGLNQINKATPSGTVTSLAGSGQAQNVLSLNFRDGIGAEARFCNPKGVALDSSGNVYVADTSNHRIRKITPTGSVTTIAGNGSAGTLDGTDTEARFYGPESLVVDSSNNIYVADTYNSKIRKIIPAVDVPGTWAWTSPSLIPSAGISTQSVTFTPSDTSKYSIVTTTVDVTVNKVTPTIYSLPSATPIFYGQNLSFSTLVGGSASVAGSFSWSSPSTIPELGNSSQSILFTPNDATNYETLTNTVSVTVNKATPAITWSNPAAITYGTALSSTQLNATSGVVGSFTYSPTNGAILNAGTNTLTAVFTTTNTNYVSPVTNTVSVTVNKATPAITADPTASDIRLGQALSTSVLNGGLATTSGGFAWSSPSTVPTYGTNSYTVMFTPTDATNFNSIFGSAVVYAKRTIDSWGALFGLSGPNISSTADPDGDGWNNAQEYAFGLTPNLAGGESVKISPNGGKIVFLQRSEVTYTVKSATNLNSGFSGTLTPTKSNPQPDGLPSEYEQYEVTFPGGNSGFLRVEATINP